MNELDHLCPDCGAAYEVADNYCRQCGMYLAAERSIATIPTESRAVASVRPGLPVPVKKAATAVAVGAALQVAVGMTGRYLARQAAKQAVSAVRSSPKPSPKVSQGREVTVKPQESKPVAVDNSMDGVTAVSETVVVQRIWMRRR
ncbi:MAG TPA: hypothetical protein VFY90_13380 [Tepidiformaceae bacterium]|nr:hypothetical protein [Tepidiformaceae bacterium]